MTKHTPGPWEVLDVVAHGLDIVSGTAEDGCEIATVHIECDTVEEAHANANLIAAAPTMLEALELAEKQLHDKVMNWADTKVYHAISQAIKAAKKA